VAARELTETSLTVSGEEQRANRQLTLRRLHAQADLSRRALTHSRRALDRGLHAYREAVPRLPPELHDGGRPVEGPAGAEEREVRARLRLLEWEAADLRQVVPGEMATPRRQFAMALYETIRLASCLGMSRDRLRYHLDYALDSYNRQDE
jgi:hypothetical protein